MNYETVPRDLKDKGVREGWKTPPSGATPAKKARC